MIGGPPVRLSFFITHSFSKNNILLRIGKAMNTRPQIVTLSIGNKGTRRHSMPLGKNDIRIRFHTTGHKYTENILHMRPLAASAFTGIMYRFAPTCLLK